ncbi:MAG: ABC transporter permease [Prevotellaceae bacterium]|nr:ABC transporter permease [Prevotellaceae bacterium]
MKILLYVRQALALIREDKQFSAIYIAGTAVAIASAMVVALTMHIRFGNIYPEVNRDRTVYVKSEFTNSGEKDWIGYNGYSPQAVEEVFSKLECAETVSAVIGSEVVFRFTVCKEIGQQEVSVSPKFTDPNFFHLYELKFVEGKPYDEGNMRNADRCVVITDALARKLYGTTQGVVGQSMQLNYLPYRVVGVVKEVSPLLRESAADIYMPYTVQDQWAALQNDKVNYAGSLEVRVLLKRGCTHEMLMKELEPYRARYLSILRRTTKQDWDWSILAVPHSWSLSGSLDASANNYFQLLLAAALFILLLLLLPAINLSGMVSNQMEARVAEMGIRKAFGAKKRVLLNEVIQENLVLTLCGGVAGYLLSWLFITAVRNSTLFLMIFGREYDPVNSVSLQLDMFFTPTLFLIAFVCCAVLNLMAALIPAWTSLKKPIVESLNQKK